MNSGKSRTRHPIFKPEYFKITIMGLGIAAFWGSLSLVLPARLLGIVPEAQKNTYLGILTFIGLIIAMVSQPIIGAISDRSQFSWGRRRPFILAGVLMAVLFLPGIGLWESVAIIAITYCLLQVASNIAQTAYQGFIPDFVPEDKRGSASSTKMTIEFLGAFLLARLVAIPIDRYSPNSDTFWLWIALGSLSVFLLIPMVITVLVVKEKAGVRAAAQPSSSNAAKSRRINLGPNRGFLWFLLSRGLMSIPGIALQTFLFYYIKDVFRVTNPAGTAGNLMIVVGLSLVISTYFAGRLSDWLGRKRLLIYAGLIGALGVLLLFFSKNLFLLLVSGTVIGIANGIFWSTSWAQGIDMAPEGQSAQHMGYVNLASAAGSGTARLIGPMIDFFNSLSRNLGYSVMLLIILVCYLASALLVLKIKEMRR